MNDKSVRNQDLLEGLLWEGEVIAFVGAGLSNKVYPLWRELVLRLCIRCGIPQDEGNIERLSSTELMQMCDKARERKPVEFGNVLTETFARKSTTRVAYRLLVQANFRNYVTTNFDCLLADEVEQYAEEGPIREKAVFAYPMCTGKAFHRRKTATYIHGYCTPGHPSSNQTLVLGASDFESAYRGDSMLPGFLNALFLDYPVCFIGYQLQEPALQRALDHAASIRSRLRVEHREQVYPMFILLEEWPALPEECQVRQLLRVEGEQIRDIVVKTEEDETAFYENFGLKVIRYPLRPEHLGLDELLRKWAKFSEPSIYRRDVGRYSE
jgi:hypothetical protein